MTTNYKDLLIRYVMGILESEGMDFIDMVAEVTPEELKEMEAIAEEARRRIEVQRNANR